MESSLGVGNLSKKDLGGLRTLHLEREKMSDVPFCDMPNLKTLFVYEDDSAEGELGCLVRECQKLEKLELFHCNVADLGPLCKLRHLQELTLHRVGEDLSPLTRLTSLKTLEVGFFNHVPTEIGSMTRLESLCFNGEDVACESLTPEFIQAIGNLPNLKTLRLDSWEYLQDLSGLRHMVVPGLEELILDDCVSLIDISPIEALKQSLKVLSVVNSPSIEKLDATLRKLGGLQGLYLSCSGNSLQSIRTLESLPRLRRLGLGSHVWNDEIMETLERLGNLEELDLRRSTWSFGSLLPLKKLKRLMVRGWSGQRDNLEGIHCLTGLQDLSLEFGTFTDIRPLKDLTALTRLSLAYCNIQSLSVLRQGFDNLEELDLDSCSAPIPRWLRM